MAINDIQVIHIKPLKRGLGAFYDVLPGEALIVGTGSAPEDLCGDDDIGALPSQLPDRLAHDLLGAAIGVDFGVIEEVNAVVPATLHKRLGFFDIELVTEADPGPIRELADLESRSTQILVLHFEFANSSLENSDQVGETEKH